MKMNLYCITGTDHGSLCYAKSEGEARRLFHLFYHGESIVYLKKATVLNY